MKKTLILGFVAIVGLASLATYATTETVSKRRILSIPGSSTIVNTAVENVAVDNSMNQKPITLERPNMAPSVVVGGSTNIVKSSEESDRVDPYGPIYSNIKYIFDESKITSYYETSIPKMYRLKCDKSAVLNKLGFTDESIFSLGLNEGKYQVSYDLNNCSAWMNLNQQPDIGVYDEKMVSTDNAYIMPYPYPSMDPINEQTAILQAKDFIAKNKVFDLIEKNLGDPIVKYRSYSDEKKTSLYNISIVFPLVIDGKQVYYQYGDIAGISIEVNSNGVSSANLSILSIILSRANSIVNGTDDIVSMIKRGGNNMYYGDGMVGSNEINVNLNAPEKIWVMVQRWNNYSSTSANYLVSGIKMKSDKKTYTDGPDYEMVISDYKIGNSNNYGIMY